MIAKDQVTIIIPTLSSERNDFARNECLTSLRESGFPMENVVLVFNNCAERGLAIASRSLIVNKEKYIFLTEQGQCKAVNAAAATVNTPWIMVSNDDMVYPPDWFERLTSWNNDDVGEVLCVSPILIEPNDGAPTFRKQFFGGVGGDWDKNGFMKFAADWATPLDLRSGFNLPFLIKKEVWDMVGGYDVNYDPWSSNSDSDLEYKLKLAGVQMYQNTNCPVYHFSQTSGTFEPQNRGYWQKNWDYFIEKWGFPRTDQGIWEATFTIPYDQLKYKPKWAKLPGGEPL